MPARFRRQWISDEGFESAGVFDVNNDGIPDIVSGAFWYEGPDFRRKHPIAPVSRHDEYHDDFSTIALDVDGDGFTDFVTGGWWGRTLRWMRNPGRTGEPWTAHPIAEVGSIETTRAWDIDGDGRRELVVNTPQGPEVRVFRHDGASAFTQHVIGVVPGGQGHGLGCGDVAGRGRRDIVLARGWFEAPDRPWQEPWTWHDDFGDAPWRLASVPMLVEDIDGDGVAELIVGNAHGYGLWWSKREGSRWRHHPIDPFHAQYHDLHWADIDGDGLPELVTGKRHRAHCGNDEGEWDDLGVYYFKWTGEGFAKVVIDHGPIGRGKGCGIHFALADLRGSGRLDLIAPGKEGLAVFFNEGP